MLPQKKLTSLPYFADSSALFSSIADQAWAVFLDSGFPHSTQGRYDIMAANPICTLVTHGDITNITRNTLTNTSTKDPFDLVKEQLLPCDDSFQDLPFNGGAIGYFSYDLARRLEKLPIIAHNAEHIADMAMGIYQWAVIVDHQKQQSFLVGHTNGDEQQWQALIKQFSHLSQDIKHAPFEVLSPVTSNMDETLVLAESPGSGTDTVKVELSFSPNAANNGPNVTWQVMVMADSGPQFLDAARKLGDITVEEIEGETTQPKLDYVAVAMLPPQDATDEEMAAFPWLAPKTNRARFDLILARRAERR